MKTFLKLIMATGSVAAGLAMNAASAADAASSSAAAVRTATVEGITEYRLPNGLSVILFPDASKPTATVNMTYKVGSRNESYGETGMAHLLEHLMFKGSKNYPSPTKEFTRRGFRMNGSTWLDRTNYHVSFTATDDNMDWALRWSADAMVNSFIAQKDLNSEMTVVRNEYEMGENDPVSVVLKRMQCILFDWHNYGKPTIGARSDIENVEIANLQNFYRRYYQPDNAVLTVSGKFDADKVLPQIESIFGAIPKPSRTLPHEWTVEPVSDGERFFTVVRPGETKLVAAGYRIPAAVHPDFASVSLAVDMLTDSPKGRLYKALVNTGLAEKVFGFVIPGKDPGFVFIGAMLKKTGDEEKVRRVMEETIETSLKKEKPAEAELASAVQEELTDYERVFADPEEFGVELSEYIGMGDWRLFFISRDSLKSVTPESVSEAASRYFVPSNRVTGMFLPQDKPVRAEIPKAKSIEELIAGHKFSEEGEQAENFDSSQDNINARTHRVKIGSIEAAFLAKKNRGGTVAVEIKPDMGNAEAMRGRQMEKSLMESLMVRGTRSMTYEQISDRMTALKMDGSITSFTTDREHAADAIRFAGEIMREASFPADEFEKLKRQSSTALQSKLDNPTALALDKLAEHFRTYPADDIRTRLTNKERLEKLPEVTREGVVNFYRSIFQNTESRIAVVGDFDEAAVTEAIRSTFTVKSEVPFERVVSEYRPVAAARYTIDTPEKENAFLIVRHDFRGNMNDADAAALIAADWIIGGGAGLSNRLADRLRQKDGLSYSVYSSVSLKSFGDRASWVALAITAPQNLSHAESDMREELERVLKDGVTEKELEEAKRGLLDSRAVNRSQDEMVAAGWVNYLAEGTDWTKSRELDEAIQKLTVSDVNRAAARLIVPGEMTWVLAGDAAKAEKEGKPFIQK